MDDDFGADADFLAALAASGEGPGRPPQQQPPPAARKIQQPTPQRLDRAPPSSGGGAAGGAKVVQPTPQPLPARSSGSAILVSPRQKGNPVLACLRSVPWEYSDIPADYGLGLTTCALFLSLKYHRLHPEYIYTRIRNLQGKFNLRILLAMVDIPNHEDSLRELSKTSLVNNVTVILCWSAAEAARYLELYKSYEHASHAAIRGQQATGYAERLVEFVTVPRSVNKADAVALVSTFGSLRAAVNADPEQVAAVGGWGEKKVRAWCKAVDEPFRAKRAAKRKLGGGSAAGREAGAAGSQQRARLEQAVPLSTVPRREMAARQAEGHGSLGGSQQQQQEQQQQKNKPRQFQVYDPDLEDEEEELAAAIEESRRMAEEKEKERAGEGMVTSSAASSSKPVEQLSDGVAAALARLREKG